LVYYLELGDYCRIAGEILNLDPERVAEFPNIGLADSALAVPRAAFGDHEAFPTLIEKAAILVERLTRNIRCLTATSAAPSSRWSDFGSQQPADLRRRPRYRRADDGTHRRGRHQSR
jgi:hypothetical protein